MKRIALFFITVGLVGCGPVAEFRPADWKAYEIGEERSATIGSAFVERETGQDIRWDVWHFLSFQWKETPWYHYQGFKREELIYSGRSGGTIKVFYREYENITAPQISAGGYVWTDQTYLARPAFYQEMQYDLAESDRIVFRDLEVEILEADNQGIQYKVLRDRGDRRE